MTKVWVVMDALEIGDLDDDDVSIAAVHASEAGANGNLTPDGTCGCKFDSPRRRYVLEMELQP